MINNHTSTLTGTVVQSRTISGGLHLHTTQFSEPALAPRQPPAPRLFIDCEQERAFLEQTWATRHGPLWVGVEGPSGSGKTALVTDWGHHHQDRWPHGALYTNLARTTVVSMLRVWLAALGHVRLSAEADELRALWCTATATRRLFVAAEHATPDTAKALFPAGPGCTGIATAHHGLDHVVATGARYVRLPVLGHGSVRELITHLLDHSLPAPLLRGAVVSTGGIPLAATLTAAVLARDLTAPLTGTEKGAPCPRV